MLEIISSQTVIKILFFLIIPAEFIFSFLFSFGIRNISKCFAFKWIFSLLCRLIFWFGFYYLWVIWLTKISNKAIFLKFFGPQFYVSYYLVFRGERWVTLLAFILWLFVYYQITVKKRKLRLFTAMILPNVLVISLFVHLYAYGGPGGFFDDQITSQVGVEKIFHINEVDHKIKSNHARGVFFDEKEQSLFAMYGCTFCDKENYPTIIRKNFHTGKINVFFSENIRQVFIDKISDKLFVGPWYQNVFYELSKQDLSIRKIFPNQIKDSLQYWEPMCIFKDLTKNRLYIGNDADPALIAYDLDTGKVDTILNLYQQGYVRIGGPVWNIVQSSKTRKLYCISGPGNNIFEVDPDTMKILKYRHCFDIIGTALELDDNNGVLYYQNSVFDSLYEIDINTFEIKREFTGEIHARRIRLDKKRNCLYVLGYFSGTVFSIDLETGIRSWSIDVGGSPHGMHFYDDTLWINSLAGVFKLDLNIIWKTKNQ